MEVVEHTVTLMVEYPENRSYIIEALEALADAVVHEGRRSRPTAGGAVLPLNVAIHLLYDDFLVLPEPQARVGLVLIAAEVQPLQALHEALAPLVADHPDLLDQTLLDDPRWPSVVRAAETVLSAGGAMDRVEPGR